MLLLLRGNLTMGNRFFIVLALVGGIMIGAAAVWVARPARSGMTAAPQSSAVTPGAASSAQVASVKAAPAAPPHPIVGSWRIRMDPLVATYTFDADGHFALVIKGIPSVRGTPAEHHASGGWRVEGERLWLDNTASTSPYSVVGEHESATIVSVTPAELVLDHVGLKGRNETLHFEPVKPFIKGTFDNPVLVGQWRSEEFTLELSDSGDASIRTERNQYNGAWTQQGRRLRLLMDPAKPLAVSPTRVRGRGGSGAAIATSPPPQSEQEYDIFNLSPDHNMLLLQPTKPLGGGRGQPVLTFYRVN